MNFNEKLIQLRKEKKYSQEELGNIIHVTRQTISNWELAISTPELNKIVELAKVFEISTDELLGVINLETQLDNPSSAPVSNTEKDKVQSREINYRKLPLDYFKIIWISVFSLLSFIGGFLPYLSSFNFYDFLFSASYQNGNWVCLFIFLAVVIQIAFFIAAIFIKKHSRIFYYIALTSSALTLSLSLLQTYFLFSSFASIGLILGLIFHGANFMCLYFLPSLKYEKDSQIDEKNRWLPILFADIAFTITMFLTLSFFQNTSPFSILIGILLILTYLLLSILDFLQDKKVFKKAKLVSSIVTFSLYIVLSVRSLGFIIIILFIAALYYVFYYLGIQKSSQQDEIILE